ncbi:MinD/ParA family protein [Actinomadura sp. 21ATH]|uniref:MinD/ParA family ATP-binding protein n=1 Tax=Actinomadura sp. 21ATH TaxID=1735444 RepID=UPI0035BFB0CC
MTDPSWQSTVLRELGVAQTGLAVPDSISPNGHADNSGMAPIHDLPPAQSMWGGGSTAAQDVPQAAPEPVAHQPQATPQPPPSQPQPQPQAQPAPQAPPQPQPQPQPQVQPEPPTFPAPPPEPPAAQPAPEPPAPPVPAPPVVEPPVPPVAEPPAPGPVPASQPEPQAAPEPPVPEPPAPGAFEIPLVGFPQELLGDPAAPGPEAPPQQERQHTGAQPAPAPVPPGPGGPGRRLDAEELVAKNRHGDPLLRRVGRGVIKGLGSGAQGVRAQGELADLLGRQVPSYRQLAVVSVRGGAGKTTMAALLATELARHRQDRVLAVDADAELGSLPLRLGVRSEYSLFDLAGRQPQTFEEATPFLARTQDGLWVLPASRNGRIAGEFTLETFQQALGAVNRYFGAAVVDCGAGILTELHGGILATTHAQVLVTPGTVDGALSARGALEWFTANGQGALLQRTVIAMVSHAPHGGADIDRAVGMLAEGGMHVVQVPYDRHLATGSGVSLDKLGAATRGAVTKVAADVFGRALGLSGVAR